VSEVTFERCVLAAPPGPTFPDWTEAVRQALGAEVVHSARHRVVWLDTFDWRLWRKGFVLEWLGGDGCGDLRLRRIGGCRVEVEVGGVKPPRWPDDLPQAGLRARLRRMTAPRVLLPVAESRGRRALLRVLGPEDKTVLRLELRDEAVAGHPPQRLIQPLPIRGYDRALRGAIQRLRAEFQAQWAATDPLGLALATLGRAPGDYSNKLAVRLNPLDRADRALKKILLHLLDLVERNEPGVREDLDPEFLHDYRVSWRRTRSLLSQVKKVLPDEEVARFAAELRWISGLTSPVRDMDVYLLEFDGYRESIPADLRPGLMPLHALLVEEKRKAHAALARALSSRRYRSFMQAWRFFLEAPPPAYTPLKNAARPVTEVASRRIWKVFRRVLGQGRTIDDASPPEDLHELRKTCKKLRYLLEAFASLYPAEPLQASIRDLKHLQDNLGEYQDLAVHAAALGTFRERLCETAPDPALTDRAIEALIESFQRRARQVRQEFADRFAAFDSKPVRKRFRALFKEDGRA